MLSIVYKLWSAALIPSVSVSSAKSLTPRRLTGNPASEQRDQSVDAPQAIATIGSYDDLIAVARARMDQLEITFATLDWISGVQSGYSAKLLGPGPDHCKTVGPISFCAIMGALGMKLLAVEDAEAMARVRQRLVRRKYRVPSSSHWRRRAAIAAAT
jgi:hypothetical protein